MEMCITEFFAKVLEMFGVSWWWVNLKGDLEKSGGQTMGDKREIQHLFNVNPVLDLVQIVSLPDTSGKSYCSLEIIL